MNKIVDLAWQNLNTIYPMLLAQSQDVFWVRSSDNQRQLYVSPAYEKIWNRRVNILYKTPHAWYDYLHPKCRKLFEKNDNQTFFNKAVTNYEYQIICPDGASCYIQDSFYPVYDSKSGGIIAYAGVAKKISNPKQMKLTQLLEKIALVKQAADVLNFRLENNSLRILAILSNREIQCMIGLLQWKTAKQIAKALQVSPKTVESYIDSAKMKLNCYTKPELVEKLISLTEAFL